MITEAARTRRREKRAAKRIVQDARITALRAEGKSCATCRHIGNIPFPERGKACMLESGGGCYICVTPEGICTRHEQKDRTNG